MLQGRKALSCMKECNGKLYESQERHYDASVPQQSDHTVSQRETGRKGCGNSRGCETIKDKPNKNLSVVIISKAFRGFSEQAAKKKFPDREGCRLFKPPAHMATPNPVKNIFNKGSFLIIYNISD